MEPLYYWHRTWDRVLIRPEDLRAIEHRLAASVGQAREGEKPWNLYPWQDRFQAAGAGSVENQIVELRGRHRTMIALNMLIARTPDEMTLKEVMDAPRRKPVAPKRTEWEGEGLPLAVELNLEKAHPGGKRPGARLEVWARGRMSGGSILSFVTPHLEKTVRKAPQPEPVGLGALLIGCAVPDALLALGLIGPAPTLILVLVLGAGLYYGAVRAMEWLFPPLELLPDEHSRTRWQKAWRAVSGVSAAIAGVIGILGFALALGQ